MLQYPSLARLQLPLQQVLSVETQLRFNKTGDKVIAVIETGVGVELQWILIEHGTVDETLGLKLCGEKLIVATLIHSGWHKVLGAAHQ